MMRHLFILARDRAGLAVPLTIALDRHLARGEQIDIMPDRRNADGTRAPQWPTGRERRRSALSEQLAVQGYAICSRQEDHPPVAGAAAPRRDPVAAPARGPVPPRAPEMAPPPPARPFAEPPPAYDDRRAEIDEMRAARAEAELAREAAFRGRMGGRRASETILDEDDWSPSGEDPYGEAPPRRRGFFAGLATAFALALLVVAGGAFLFASQIRDYLADLTPPRREAVEPTRDTSRTLAANDNAAGRSPAPAAPAPSAPALAPTPAMPTPSATADATPPREALREPAATPSHETAREPASTSPRETAREPAATPPRETARQPAATPPRETARQPVATPPREPAREAARSASASRDASASREPALPSAPAPARDVALPPRETEASRELPPPSLPPRRADLSSPSATRTQRLPDFPGLPHVDVSRASGQDGTTFTVRVTDQRGSPMSGAQVMLRQKSTDGHVRETMLEPIAPAGSYRGALPTAPGRQTLTVRVVLGDRRVEMPLSE
jgi:hypothetical protein